MSQLDELREIIVGDNTEQLAELKERVEDAEQRAADVAEVLAPAINKTMQRDDHLVTALTNPISQSLKRAIKREPGAYANILYPAIAPSIRNAIAQAISSLLATINKTIESATTVGGLRARFQSIRTGVPYAEILLRKSLLYRVEHLYLIDRESGLLIDECSAVDQDLMDSDSVSAMFSAIQSFVQDSFSGSDEDRLTDFKVGSHNVWIAHGPDAMLACVILGDAPESLKYKMYDTLDNIHLEYAQPLQNFDGDASAFLGLHTSLQPLLKSQLKSAEDAAESKSWQWGPKLAYGVMAMLICYWLFQSVDRQSKLNTIHRYFDGTPGVVVTKAFWEKDQVTVEGLFDPDAELPLKILSKHGLSEDRLRLNMTPFRSLERELERRRFAGELKPPAGVAIEVQENKLALVGSAPVKWLLKHDERLRQLRSDNRLDLSALFATEVSLLEYIEHGLAIPVGPGGQKLFNRLQKTPWVNISFDNFRRDVSRHDRS